MKTSALTVSITPTIVPAESTQKNLANGEIELAQFAIGLLERFVVRALRGQRYLAIDWEQIANDTLFEILLRFSKQCSWNEAHLTRMARRIFSNKLTDAVRHSKRSKRGGVNARRTTMGTHDLACQIVTSGTNDPTLELEHDETLEGWRQVLSNDDLFEVVLCKIDGMSSREIATATGYSLRTIERRWQRAIAVLCENCSLQSPVSSLQSPVSSLQSPVSKRLGICF